jgi:phosphoribosylformimino-5-aminoimidazole carboxamide ribotide isomerase
MLVIPAIDLKEGRCVRLKQGVMSEETVFSTSPQDMAARWYEAGAERIHVVDLDGALHGRPRNTESVKQIVKAVPVPVQLGGGIRDKDAVEAYLDLGISQVILGTAAWMNPVFVREMCSAFPGRIILGIDARQGRVAVEGWTEETDLDPIQMARQFEKDGLHALVYTDISRDGMGTGPNLDATGRLARAVDTPVIASGGIGGLEDVMEVLSLEKDGVMGVITGRALYDGRLDLAKAIQATKNHLRGRISLTNKREKVN